MPLNSSSLLISESEPSLSYRFFAAGATVESLSSRGDSKDRPMIIWSSSYSESVWYNAIAFSSVLWASIWDSDATCYYKIMHLQFYIQYYFLRSNINDPRLFYVSASQNQNTWSKSGWRGSERRQERPGWSLVTWHMHACMHACTRCESTARSTYTSI